MRSHAFKDLLTPAEHAAFRELKTPIKIQDYLDSIPTNFELDGETYMSPRRTLRAQTAHCFEGALLAAAALSYHGRKAILMDFRTIPEDEDHVVTLFKENGYWGAISKTSHPILRYRDAVYKTPRELALSYFHEYVMWEDGRKSLREYSKPIDLAKYELSSWLVAEDDLHWLVQDVDDAPHLAAAPKALLRKLRPASKFELDAMRVSDRDVVAKPRLLKK